MKILLPITLCLALAVFARAQGKTVIKSVRAASDVSLDANPASPFWRKAKPVYAESDKNGHPLPQYRTEVRSRWTSTDIYFMFVCPYKNLYLKPSPDAEHETYELWNWNVAEVFIGSDFKDIKRYKEFELSPHNEWIDLDIDLNKPHHEEGWKWNSGFEHVTRIDEHNHVWYAAWRIPFKALDPRAAKAGNTFRVNFYRTEAGPQDTKEIMWQPVMSDSFHVPERFGLLRLSR
jgi:hypothetical protein